MSSKARETKKALNACSQCQRRKKRCDNRSPKCSSCTERSLTCIYEGVRRRGPGKGRVYLQKLEARVAELESTLGKPANTASSGLVAPDTSLTNPSYTISPNHSARARDLVAVPGNSPSVTDADTAQKDAPRDQPTTPKSARLSAASCSYNGAISSAKERLFAAFPERQTVKSFSSQADHGPFISPIFIQLPPKHQAQSMFEVAFNEINYILPLFNAHILSDLLEEHYADPTASPGKNPARWAMLNAAIAVAIQSRAALDSQTKMIELSWSFFKNAFTMYSAIAFRGADVLALEALLAMAIFMQGSSDMWTTSALISTAVRLSLTLGLHQKSYYSLLNSATATRSMRVFWITYILDKDMSASTGLPSLYDDSVTSLGYSDLTAISPSSFDTDVELPSALLRARVELAMIIHRLEVRLYHGTARSQNTWQLLEEVVELDGRLESWKKKLPSNFHPNHINWSAAPAASVESILILYFAYYQALISTHWFAADLEPDNANSAIWQGRSSNDIQASAASQIIRLLHHFPTQQPGRLWHMMQHPISACITLLLLVYKNPTDTLAFSHIHDIGRVVNFLSQLDREKVLEVGPLLSLCHDLESQAVHSVSETVSIPKILGHSSDRGGLAMQEPRLKILTQVTRATSSVQLAQGLIGNIPSLRSTAFEFFSGLIPAWQAPPFETSLAPSLLIPERHGFAFA
ncbi:hypothetical protein BDV26DRAFT_297999 [Aspergillus bertholletiae]|uniref:Zn(2)-C6 fungal-type domain-containing protein n=1 Tax=Aspergillus bertholletiae TaxID=1226010 RepID=A0A5N7AQZ1_9EURO|nr:hypothetical protein BDV26DRAFT_297999 [Aspergillus bertholletiae]